MELISDVPGYNSTFFRFTWFSSVPEGKFGLTVGFYHAVSFLILSSSLYTIHAMIVSLNKPKYFPLNFNGLRTKKCVSLTYQLSFFSIRLTSLRTTFSACRNAKGVGTLLVTVLVRSSSPVLFTLYVAMHRMAQPLKWK